MIAFVNNDNLIRLTGAQTTALSTGLSTYLGPSAIVQFRVQTLEHVDVPGDVWPSAMTYVTGSQGDFLGVLRNEVVLTADTDYRLVATINNGTDQFATYDLPLRVLTRTA